MLEKEYNLNSCEIKVSAFIYKIYIYMCVCVYFRMCLQKKRYYIKKDEFSVFVFVFGSHE